MFQENLFAAPARTTGFMLHYYEEVGDDGPDGFLWVKPAWSKNPSGPDGKWERRLRGDAVEYVPELMREVYYGWATTQPQRSLPRSLERAYRQAQLRQEQCHYQGA